MWREKKGIVMSALRYIENQSFRKLDEKCCHEEDLSRTRCPRYFKFIQEELKKCSREGLVSVVGPRQELASGTEGRQVFRVFLA